MTDLEKWIADGQDGDQFEIMKNGSEIRLRRFRWNNERLEPLDYFLFYDVRSSLGKKK